MRIGELADRSGFPTRTIRFYERRGLLPVPARDPNGYRRYGPDTTERLRFIANAQAAGLTLAEIRGVLDIRDTGTPPCAHVTDLLNTKRRAIREQLKRLRALETELGALIERSALLDPADCRLGDICHILHTADPTPHADQGGHEHA